MLKSSTRNAVELCEIEQGVVELDVLRDFTVRVDAPPAKVSGGDRVSQRQRG